MLARSLRCGLDCELCRSSLGEARPVGAGVPSRMRGKERLFATNARKHAPCQLHQHLAWHLAWHLASELKASCAVGVLACDAGLRSPQWRAPPRLGLRDLAGPGRASGIGHGMAFRCRAGVVGAPGGPIMTASVGGSGGDSLQVFVWLKTCAQRA